MGTIITLAVVVVLLAVSVLLGLAASWKRQDVSEDYFLGDRSLPWYVVALGLAGPCLRLEFWLGMIALASATGLATAAFAWGNLLALTVLLWVFLPFFYRKKLFTSAEFLERRYSPPARAVYSVLALLGLVLGVLVPALYVGGWTLAELGLGQSVEGISWAFVGCIAAIAVITAIYSVYGGVTAGTWAAAVQMLVAIAGGILLTIVAVRDGGGLTTVAQNNGAERLHLLLPANSGSLPWTGVLAMVLTLAVWQVAANPVTVQRCLAARTEWDAKMGVIAAGCLLLVLPALIVLPGLAVFAKLGKPLTSDPTGQHLLSEIIAGLLGRGSILGALELGVVVAAVLAAVMSTISGVANAASAIWTMDIGQDLLQHRLSEADLVRRGRRSSLIVLALGALLAPLVAGFEKGVFDFVLEVAAVIGPPVAVVFLVAFFWSRAHGRAATATLVAGAVAGILMWLVTEVGEPEAMPQWLLPVLNRAGLNGLFSLVVLALGTVAIPQNPRELYDPNTTWNFSWSRLPPQERELAAGPRSLLFWWALLAIATAAAWVVFR
jgi:solute:Na+ symporter, SSS family